MAVLTLFTIDEVDVRPFLLDGSLRVNPRANGRGSCEFALADRAGVYIPPRRGVVSISFDGVATFGGIVWKRRISDISDQAGEIIGRGARVIAMDYSALADVVFINGIIPAGTIKDQFEFIVQNLVPHGLSSVDPWPADGPAQTEWGADTLTIREALDQLTLRTNWLWRFRPDSEGLMTQGGTVASPGNITDALNNYRQAFWEDDLSNYNNGVIVRYGPNGTREIAQEEVFQGNGATTSWALTYRFFAVPTRGYVVVQRTGGNSNETVDTDISGGAQWHFVGDDDAAILVQNTGLSAVLGTGESVRTGLYWARWPSLIILEDAAERALEGPFTRRVDRPDLLVYADAYAVAQAELARTLGNPRKLTVITPDAGFLPLQTTHATMAHLDFDEDVLITEARSSEIVNQTGQNRVYEHTITAIEGNVHQGNWEDFYRQTHGIGAGGGPPGVSLPQPNIPPDHPTPTGRATGTQTTDATSHPITLPFGITAGELLLVIFSCDAAPTVTVDTGVSGANWTKFGQQAQSTNVVGAIFWKICEGPTDVLTLTTDSAQQSSHVSMRITYTHTTSPVYGAAATSSLTNTNPPNLTPGAGEQRYLWIATRHGDSNANVATAAPTNFSQFLQIVGTVNGATTATAERQLLASSLDPGAWTSGLAFSASYTLAIRPPA